MKNITMCSLNDDSVASVLNKLHKNAQKDSRSMKKIVADTIVKVITGGKNKSVLTSNPLIKANILKDVYIPVCEDIGLFIYLIARSIKAKNIVEFGTSFGISTIYLASAVRDNGGGKVITTELSAEKVIKAKKNINNAGLASYVEIYEGDALSTLRNIDLKIDLLFLDGWKDLYLPILQLLEDKLEPGSVILADDAVKFKHQFKDFFSYINNIENFFRSLVLPIDDGISFIVKTQ